MDANLVFEQPAGDGAHLVFGDQSASPIAGDDVLALPVGVFPQLAGVVGVYVPERVAARPAGAFPPLAGYVGASWSSGVSRSLGMLARGLVQQAMAEQRRVVDGFSQAHRVGSRIAAHAHVAQQMGPRWIARFVNTAQVYALRQAHAQQAVLLQRDWQLAFESAAALATQPLGRWQIAQPAHGRWHQAFQTAVWLRGDFISRHQIGVPLWLAIASRADMADYAATGWYGGSYQPAMPAPPRWRVLPPDGTSPTKSVCYVPSGHLVFCQIPDGTADLVFECGNACQAPTSATIHVPIQRVYIVQNSITLTRLDGGVELHPLTFELSLDADSWTWTWSATLHASVGGHLGRQPNGEAPEVEAVINGQAVRLRLEKKALDERFLPARWSVGGAGNQCDPGRSACARNEFWQHGADAGAAIGAAHPDAQWRRD